MLCIIALGLHSFFAFMDSRPLNRSWKVLCWNIRGIDAKNKWESIKNKITKSSCDIISIQETKRETFDITYIRKFCPSSFDEFCFLPSIGASRGILVVWKSSVFSGNEIFHNNFAILVEFSSTHNNDPWILTSVYGPCDSEGKETFMN